MKARTLLTSIALGFAVNVSVLMVIAIIGSEVLSKALNIPGVVIAIILQRNPHGYSQGLAAFLSFLIYWGLISLIIYLIRKTAGK